MRTCKGITNINKRRSRSVRKFLKKVYPVPMSIIVPKSKAPFSLNVQILKAVITKGNLSRAEKQ